MNKNRFWSLASPILLLGTILVIWGCSKTSPLSSSIDDKANSLGSQSVAAGVERIPGSDAYAERVLQLNDGTFTIREGALNLPSELSLRKEVEISVTTEVLPNGNLHLTFGPAGATFDPPAEVDVEWPGAESANFSLYYIDNGNYIEQPASDIETGEESVRLFIHHFSEYELDDE